MSNFNNFQTLSVGATGRRPCTLTQVVLLDVADVAVEGAVAEEDEHDGAVVPEGDDVGRVPHHGVLLLGLRGQRRPALPRDVEHPQLAAHVPRGIDLTAVHVDVILKQVRSNKAKEFSI